MSSTKQLMQGRSNTGWSIRDSSCRNCHHYDRVGTYLCPHHRIGHNLECGSCNIRLGTQHLPAIHVRVLRDKVHYRASFIRRNRPRSPHRRPLVTAATDPQIVPRPLAAAPALRAADQGVADALESVLSDNTRRVYGAQWRLFTGWCDDVGLQWMPADRLTVARYLAVRAGTAALDTSPVADEAVHLTANAAWLAVQVMAHNLVWYVGMRQTDPIWVEENRGPAWSSHPILIEPEQLPGPIAPASCKEGPTRKGRRSHRRY